MEPSIIPLYYLCSLAGLIMVAGGIWLLYKQKIYIDRETKEVTEIDTPVGKFKTNVPALVLFALGFVPLIYPIVQSAKVAKEIEIRGNVRGNAFPVQVYAVIRSDSLLGPRDFILRVPIVKQDGDDYKIVYQAGNIVLEDLVRGGSAPEVLLPPKEISTAGAGTFEPRVTPVPAEFR